MLVIDTPELRSMRRRVFDEQRIKSLCNHTGRGCMHAILLQNEFGLGDFVEGEQDGQYQRGQSFN